jgi:hypothetical protein
MAEDWRGDLEVWLAPFLLALRHKTRMRLCPAYIAGLIGPGDRKSVQPMAARDGVLLQTFWPWRGWGIVVAGLVISGAAGVG